MPSAWPGLGTRRSSFAWARIVAIALAWRRLARRQKLSPAGCRGAGRNRAHAPASRALWDIDAGEGGSAFCSASHRCAARIGLPACRNGAERVRECRSRSRSLRLGSGLRLRLSISFAACSPVAKLTAAMHLPNIVITGAAQSGGLVLLQILPSVAVVMVLAFLVRNAIRRRIDERASARVVPRDPASWTPHMGWVFVLSAAGFAAEVLIVVSTVLPGAPLLPLQAPDILFFGVFIVAIPTVMEFHERQQASGLKSRNLSVRDLQGLVAAPPAVTRAFYGYFALAAAIALISLLMATGGDPGHGHGHYWLNNHGVVTNVSRSTYLQAVAVSQRIFSVIPSVFYALAILFHWPGATKPAQATAA